MKPGVLELKPTPKPNAGTTGRPKLDGRRMQTPHAFICSLSGFVFLLSCANITARAGLAFGTQDLPRVALGLGKREMTPMPQRPTDFGRQTSDFGRQTSEFGRQTSVRTTDFGHQIAPVPVRSAAFVRQTSPLEAGAVIAPVPKFRHGTACSSFDPSQLTSYVIGHCRYEIHRSCCSFEAALIRQWVCLGPGGLHLFCASGFVYKIRLGERRRGIYIGRFCQWRLQHQPLDMGHMWFTTWWLLSRIPECDSHRCCLRLLPGLHGFGFKCHDVHHSSYEASASVAPSVWHHE